MYESKFDLEATIKGNLIVKLAAKSMIRDLEENRSFMHDPKGHLKVHKDLIQKEILKLSLGYLYLCSK